MFEFVIHMSGEEVAGEGVKGSFTGTAYAQAHTVQGTTMEEAVKVAVTRAQKKVPSIKKFNITVNRVTYLVV